MFRVRLVVLRSDVLLTKTKSQFSLTTGTGERDHKLKTETSGPKKVIITKTKTAKKY